MNKSTALARATLLYSAAIAASLLGAAPAQAGGGTPAFVKYAAPAALNDSNSAGEPPIGVNWKTGAVMLESYSSTYKIVFSDSTTPANAGWTDVSAGVLINLDPILFTDASIGRTYVGGEAGSCGNLYKSDNDGSSWQAMGNACAGTDHETIGAGPWHGSAPLLSTYNRAVYYCAQSSTDVCAVSSDGGTTFGAPVTVSGACSSLHGHVKVSADGTAYLPNAHCGGKPGGGISSNNGSAWSSYTIPSTATQNGFDPSVATTPDNTLYEAWADANNHPMVAVSTNHGTSWTKITDLSMTLSPSIVNSTFQTMTAGDNGRAAVAFLGSTTAGDPFSNTWHGVWDLYVSFTYDAGASWTTVKATTDPVQRGWMCSAGTTCGNGRNLLDFIDAAVTKDGRVVVGYADGCVDNCVFPSGTEAQSTSAWATIARQQSGKGLFAAYDTSANTVPGAPTLSATAGNNQVALSWTTPANGGSAITGYHVNRGTTSGGETLLATVGAVSSYTDSGVSNGTTYYYTVAAVNAVGTGAASGEAMARPAASNQAPVASFTRTCTNLACTFTDTSTDADGSIASRSWNFGDGATSTAANPSHTYAAAGTYTVSLTVTDNGGATGSTSQSVTVTAATGGGPCSDCTKVSGTLASGATAYSPSSSGFTSNGGAFKGYLRGPASGADFDLYLEKYSSGVLGGWSSVASGTTTSASEDVTYSGAAGTYRWRIYSYSGSGSYDFYYKNP